MSLGIKYLGAISDGSGYSEFARGFVASVYKSGLANICVEPVSYESPRADYGEAGEICSRLMKAKIDYNVKIINILPENMRSKREKGKKNISFTMFETTRIPDVWVESLNDYSDAVFVPCSWNKKVFRDSGVKVPIKVVPPGIDPGYYKDIKHIDPIALDLPKDAFCFYSIFQWTERKNPAGLLRAFWAAFDGVDDVYLVLKTYGTNVSLEQQRVLKETIAQLKANMRLKKPPKIIFVGGFLSKAEMTGIHKRCDCFVLPHRAEGFGLPHLEAMAMGNPVISTGYSGNMDFMTPENSYLLDYQLTPVTNMPWIPYYEGTMLWAEPNLSQLIDYMKYVYEYRKEAQTVGELGRAHVMKKFNWEISAKKLVQACQEIVDG